MDHVLRCTVLRGSGSGSPRLHQSEMEKEKNGVARTPTGHPNQLLFLLTGY
jgi:hypothetical protein